MSNEKKITKEQRDSVLHILRNPYGWSDDAVRDVRQRSASELERLWRLEKHVQQLTSDLLDAVGKEGS